MKIKLNTTYQGDCLKLMGSIPDGSVDMVLCDLPYGVTENKWDSVIDPAKLWEAYLRVCKKNAAIVLTATQPFTSALIVSQMKLYRYSWIWIKSNAFGFLNAKKQPMRKNEDVNVFYRNQPVYNPQGLFNLSNPKFSPARVPHEGNTKAERDGMKSSISEVTGYPTNVLEFASETETFHPTQKPVALFEYLIRTYTNEGDTVLDNTCGSGTTGVACKRSGRNFIQMDMSEEYCIIARKRYEDNLWKVPYRVPDGQKRLL
jgi:site-specific DNA-methyltransferase (adenine-specific)